MKFTEINDKSVADLQAMLKEKKSQMFELRLKLKTMQLTNPNEIRAMRRDIARIMTTLRTKKDA